MTLTSEQIKELKDQLRTQVNHLPEEQKSQALQQIDEMSSEALESLLKQQQSQSQTSQAIFRMIVNGEIPSTKIDENQHAIAVLSVRSISEGHTIIIPKEQVSTSSEFSEPIQEFAKTISKKLIENLNAKSVRKDIQNLFGEKTYSLIPIYDKPLDQNSPQTEKTPEELEKTKQKINIIKIGSKPENLPIQTQTKSKKVKKPRKKIIKLKRRIP